MSWFFWINWLIDWLIDWWECLTVSTWITFFPAVKWSMGDFLRLQLFRSIRRHRTPSLLQQFSHGMRFLRIRSANGAGRGKSPPRTHHGIWLYQFGHEKVWLFTLCRLRTRQGIGLSVSCFFWWIFFSFSDCFTVSPTWSIMPNFLLTNSPVCHHKKTAKNSH